MQGMVTFDYDVLVVGSGFGGSVTALRATEKGYRVGVIEAGRRFDKADLPKTSWQLRKFLWAPKLGLRGIQRITPLKDIAVLSGAGVGGGSLIYANTLLLRLRDEGRLPGLSDRLGDIVRTNSEAIMGASGSKVRPELSRGVAITSSIHPDETTHIEPCRYPPKSNAMGLLTKIGRAHV